LTQYFSAQNGPSEEANQLFLLMIRLLSTKLSVLITVGAIRDGADCRTLCSQMIALATVFMESNPRWAYDIVSAFDQVLPLISGKISFSNNNLLYFL
jgi:hypothetical protein